MEDQEVRREGPQPVRIRPRHLLRADVMRCREADLRVAQVAEADELVVEDVDAVGRVGPRASGSGGRRRRVGGSGRQTIACRRRRERRRGGWRGNRRDRRARGRGSRRQAGGHRDAGQRAVERDRQVERRQRGRRGVEGAGAGVGRGGGRSAGECEHGGRDHTDDREDSDVPPRHAHISAAANAAIASSSGVSRYACPKPAFKSPPVGASRTRSKSPSWNIIWCLGRDARYVALADSYAGDALSITAAVQSSETRLRMRTSTRGSSGSNTSRLQRGSARRWRLWAARSDRWSRKPSKPLSGTHATIETLGRPSLRVARAAWRWSRMRRARVRAAASSKGRRGSLGGVLMGAEYNGTRSGREGLRPSAAALPPLYSPP